jgi:DNA-binding NarL/FixJ family response regulator
MYDELLYAERALKAGAKGYVMKDVSIATLLEAVRRALAGNVTVGERVTTKILSLFGSGRADEGKPEVSRLSDRELAIFRLIGGGLTTREIAERVGLSIKTVESHRLHIKKKLGLESANRLVVHAAAWVLDER